MCEQVSCAVCVVMPAVNCCDRRMSVRPSTLFVSCWLPLTYYSRACPCVDSHLHSLPNTEALYGYYVRLSPFICAVSISHKVFKFGRPNGESCWKRTMKSGFCENRPAQWQPYFTGGRRNLNSRRWVHICSQIYTIFCAHAITFECSEFCGEQRCNEDRSLADNLNII